MFTVKFSREINLGEWYCEEIEAECGIEEHGYGGAMPSWNDPGEPAYGAIGYVESMSSDLGGVVPAFLLKGEQEAVDEAADEADRDREPDYDRDYERYDG